MYTSVTLVALSGLLAAPNPGGPSWHNDYASARKQGQSEGKPLAVFIGSGRAGYKKVCSEGELTRPMRDLLAKKYVCVYVDTAKESGQRLARAFRMENGIVISDRQGDIQAFRYNGSLENQDLRRYLEKYAEGNLVVRETATHVTTERLSYYEPPVTEAPVSGGFGGFSGGFSRGGSC